MQPQIDLPVDVDLKGIWCHQAPCHCGAWWVRSVGDPKSKSNDVYEAGPQKMMMMMMDDSGAAGGGGGVYYLKWEIGEGCASLEVSLVLVFRSTNERHFLVCFFCRVDCRGSGLFGTWCSLLVQYYSEKGLKWYQKVCILTFLYIIHTNHGLEYSIAQTHIPWGVPCTLCLVTKKITKGLQGIMTFRY